jgi:hypothetical protein
VNDLVLINIRHGSCEALSFTFTAPPMSLSVAQPQPLLPRDYFTLQELATTVESSSNLPSKVGQYLATNLQRGFRHILIQIRPVGSLAIVVPRWLPRNPFRNFPSRISALMYLIHRSPIRRLLNKTRDRFEHWVDPTER